MVALLEEVRIRSLVDNEYLGTGKIDAIRAELDALPADAPARERWMRTAHLGEGEVLLGREREGLEHLLEAERMLPAVRGDLPDGWEHEMRFRLAVAWLRLGETENCCARNSPGACILPLTGEAIHERPEGSRKAMEVLEGILAETDADSPMHLQCVWLLNLAHMTLGSWPDGVPAAYRIPPAAFASDAPFPRFPNIAQRLGLDSFTQSGGAVAEDFDGDGDLDLLVSDLDTGGPIRLFRNEGDGTFTRRVEEAHLGGIFGGLNLVQGDYDNDGDEDVLVLRGAWFGNAGRHPNSLLRNEGDGTFTDVTFDAGLAEKSWPSQTAAWADYDGDGDLDLFVGNETYLGLEAPCQLFRNDGNGTFTDVAAAAGVTNMRCAKGTSWGDYDGDGRPDLYVSNFLGPNRLYRNRGDGTFEDVAPRLGVDGPEKSFPAWFFDFDNDGVLDLFVSGFPAVPAELAAAALGKPHGAPLHRLYRGDGKGGFTDVAGERGLHRPTAPMGANFGDLDNDGWPDIFLGTGNTGLRDVMPNQVWRNDGGRRFLEIAWNGGFAHLQKGHAVVFADLDHDGDLDVFEQMGGAFRGDRFRDALFENPGFGNRWLAVRLRGVKANRSAIGAHLRAEFTDGGEKRVVHRVVNSGGSFGANPLRQHLGLGAATRVDRLVVTWPGSGTVQEFRDLPAGRLFEITEGKDAPRVVELTPVRLGGGKR